MADKVGEITRNSIMEICRKALEDNGYEVLVVGSNAYAVPAVEDGNETAVKLVASVPKGERGGAGYDPYEDAQAYAFKQSEKEKKKKKKDEKKE